MEKMRKKKVRKQRIKRFLYSNRYIKAGEVGEFRPLNNVQEKLIQFQAEEITNLVERIEIDTLHVE